MTTSGDGSRKVGIVVVTHGGSGEAMIAVLGQLLGPEAIEGMEAISVAPRESRASIRERIAQAIARQDSGRGVLLVSDLQGSTPANCCVELKHADEAHRVVLCGLSLPMLVKLASADREQLSPAELARLAAETAIRSVRLAEGEKRD